MRILLAADIFGVTGHLLAIAAICEGGGHRCRTVGPYPPSLCFDDEGRAYAAFMEHGGVDRYTANVRENLSETDGDPLLCIGFSAGAAALWQAMADPAAEAARLAVCLYGSQIRHATAIEPRCPCLLVFPEKEPHFSVEGVLGRLQGRDNVCCATVPWRHGYMNRLSRNFDQQGYERTMEWLGWLLCRQDPAAECRSALDRLVGRAV
jgi:dienelactone hydrolase